MSHCSLIPCTDGIFENQRFIDWKCLEIQTEFHKRFQNQLSLQLIVYVTEMPSLQLIKHPRQSQIIAVNSTLFLKNPFLNLMVYMCTISHAHVI